MTTPFDKAPLSEMRMIRSMTEQILRNPYGLGKEAWSLQGFGMLRLYMPEKALRFHVWDSRFAVPNVSLHHDHPWEFRSLIVAGQLRNIRYKRYGADELVLGDVFMEQTIQCGPGGCAKGDPTSVKLIEQGLETYHVGDWYHQTADEIHISKPEDGSVTIIDRTFNEDAEHARVYWQGTWVSAEPRPATEDELRSILSNSLEKWFQ
jgi:hypothetical protein